MTRITTNISTSYASCAAVGTQCCNNCKLVVELIQQLSDNLRALEFRGRPINDCCAEKIAEALKRSGFICDALRLERNGLTTTAVEAIYEALSENRTVTSLTCGSNSVGDNCAARIASVLVKNEKLTDLILCDNEIGARGAAEIAEPLAGINRTLSALNLQRNKLGNQGAVYFEDVLQKNLTLKTLELEGNKIEEGILGNISFLLRRNRIQREHIMGVKEHGAAFYVSLKDSSFKSGNRENMSLEWNSVHIKEAAMDDVYGATLPLVHRVLETLLQNKSYTLSWCTGGKNGVLLIQPPSPKLAAACRQKGAVKNLVEATTIGGSSSLLHLVVAEKRSQPDKRIGWDDHRGEEEGGTVSADVVEEDERATATDDKTEGDDASKVVPKDNRDVLILNFCKFLVDDVKADLDVKDGYRRTARNIALASQNEYVQKWARSVGTLFGRYNVEKDRHVHKSPTSTVWFAEDVTKVDAPEESRYVAIKIVGDRVLFKRELSVRLLQPETIQSGQDIAIGSNRFDENHALKIHRYHDEADENGKHVACLVMPRADRNLDHVIGNEGVAGHDIDLIKHFAKEAAAALEHMHSVHDIVHCNLTPKNVVRIGHDYKLIDFSRSVKIGTDLNGDFMKSTGYCPPEVAKALFFPKEEGEDLHMEHNGLSRSLKVMQEQSFPPFLIEKCKQQMIRIEEKIDQLKAGQLLPKAHQTLDVWAYTVLMYHMLTGRSLFQCDGDGNLVDEEEERQLLHWKQLSEKHLKWVLRDCRGATAVDVRDAKELLKRGLEANPKDRPQTMTEVLNMPFLSGSTNTWTPGKRNRVNVLFADPLVWAQEGRILPFGPRLNFGNEKNHLIRCISDSQKDIELFFNAATYSRLQELARLRCGCLHFSGHGRHNSCLVFENGKGGAELCSSVKLQQLLSSYPEPFKFVFVSACHSEDIGQSFINAGVEHVVCCESRSELNDDAAIDFTSSFYDALVKGDFISVAFNSARGLVSTRYDDEESKKFLLLPESGQHDVPLFDADFAEQKETGERPPIPALPANFIGRELIMHNALYEILSPEKRLVTLLGCEGSGRSSVASAICHYVNDRIDDMLVIDAAIYVQRNREIRSLEASLLEPCYKQLFDIRIATRELEGREVRDCICEALKVSKVLLVFDGLDGLEDSDELHHFLSQLFHKASMVRVFLTSHKRTRFSSSSVVETFFELKPLDCKSAAQLFGKWCPHADTGNKRLDLLHLFLSETASGTRESARQSSRSTFRTVCEGSPSKIIKAAQNISADEYSNLFSEPLNNKDAATLFARTCPHSEKEYIRSDLGNILLSEVSTAMPRRCSEHMVHAVVEGKPKTIIECAKTMSREAYDDIFWSKLSTESAKKLFGSICHDQESNASLFASVVKAGIPAQIIDVAAQISDEYKKAVK